MRHMTDFPTGGLGFGSGVRLDIVDTREGFWGLEGPWNALFERVGRPHQLFQTFNWLWHWTEQFLDSRATLTVIVGWRDDRLVMAWPLIRTQGRGGLVTLGWMGEPLGQYGDVLLDMTPDGADLLRRGWNLVETLGADLVSLRKVRADAVVAPLLAAVGGLRTEASEAPFVDLSGADAFAAFEQRYSGKKRSTRRRLLRRLQEISTVAFETHREGPRALACVRQALAWKKAWLAETGYVSPALRDPRFDRVFEAIASAETRKAAIRVSAVTCDGELAGVEVAFTCKGTVFGHLLAYDPRYAKQGVGVVLAGQSIRGALEEGFATFDLLAPRDNYKMDWADATVAVADHAVPLTRKGALYARIWLVAARPVAKRILKHLPVRARRLLSRPLRAGADHDRDGTDRLDADLTGADDAVLMSLKAVSDAEPSATASLDTHRKVRDWIQSYLMQAHADLGRPGLVCPFTAHAARIDTVRIAVCDADGSDMAPIEARIDACFRAFKDIPCPPRMKAYRTILIAFPRLVGGQVDLLHKVQARIKLATLRSGLMTAVFHEGNEAQGLWNPAFRPLRAPIPMFVIRQLVENDAPFVAGHPLLLPTYLIQFPIGGPRRLFAHVAKKLKARRMA